MQVKATNFLCGVFPLDLGFNAWWPISDSVVFTFLKLFVACYCFSSLLCLFQIHLTIIVVFPDFFFFKSWVHECGCHQINSCLTVWSHIISVKPYLKSTLRGRIYLFLVLCVEDKLLFPRYYLLHRKFSQVRKVICSIYYNPKWIFLFRKSFSFKEP